MIKSGRRHAGSRGWGRYNFNRHEPKAFTAKLLPKSEYVFRRNYGAKKNGSQIQIHSPPDQRWNLISVASLA